MTKALGLIETIGLVTAFEAADSAIKAANVQLLGYENTRGGGRITVKFVGDVGAVKAAVAAGAAAALRIGRIESCLVIPRPHGEIESLITQVDRGPAAANGAAGEKPAAPVPTDQVKAVAAKKAAAPKPAAAPKLEKPKPAPAPAKPKPPAKKAAPAKPAASLPPAPVEPEPPQPPAPAEPEPPQPPAAEPDQEKPVTPPE